MATTSGSLDRAGSGCAVENFNFGGVLVSTEQEKPRRKPRMIRWPR